MCIATKTGGSVFSFKNDEVYRLAMEFPEQEEKVIAFIALGFAPFKPAHFKTAILLLDVFGEVLDP